MTPQTIYSIIIFIDTVSCTSPNQEETTSKSGKRVTKLMMEIQKDQLGIHRLRYVFAFIMLLFMLLSNQSVSAAGS